MFEFSSAPSTEDIVRDDVLFSVDGVKYSIPRTVPTWVGLEMSVLAIENGVGAAQVFALRTCLGETGFDALRQAKDITSEQLDTVIDVCVERCTGPKSPAASSD